MTAWESQDGAERESREQAMARPALQGPWACGDCSRRPQGSPGSALSQGSRRHSVTTRGGCGPGGGSERDPPPCSCAKLSIWCAGLGVD